MNRWLKSIFMVQACLIIGSTQARLPGFTDENAYWAEGLNQEAITIWIEELNEREEELNLLKITLDQREATLQQKKYALERERVNFQNYMSREQAKLDDLRELYESKQ